MHDLTFAQEILNVLSERSNSLDKGTKIKAVNASLSPLSHVKPETLKETFTAVSKETQFNKIKLIIKPLELRIKCQVCRHSFSTAKPITACPKCDSADLDIAYSKEFSIDSIEVEKTSQ